MTRTCAILLSPLLLLAIIPAMMQGQRAEFVRFDAKMESSIKTIAVSPLRTASLSRSNRKLVGALIGIGVGTAIVLLRYSDNNQGSIPDHFIIDPAIIVVSAVVGAKIAMGR
jgi:hypothetical protein